MVPGDAGSSPAMRAGGGSAPPSTPPEKVGTDAPPLDRLRPAPPPPADHAADAVWGAAAMAPARERLHRDHGGMRLHQILFNLAEIQVRRGEEGFRWDGEGWWGGDVNRLVLKSEGEARFGRVAEAAEVQLLYSRAIGPYHDLQAGVRQDLGAGVRRTYASIGIEGLAPYWFETEGTVFVSDKGDVLARAEAWYDQRITQRLVLQPRVELNLAAQNVPEQRIGEGLSTAELGLRLRYEIRREFAPYVGVAWDRKVGITADYARADGIARGRVAAVFGVRGWL
ncbi:copper resistance protein B [Sphingomonas sp. NFR15]|uniref:copper resistance protein B n=1 Tax=Sphingomonas sp. NFR15 TaxID=1566282 RepID=UPI0008890FD4|nr:copper resistance protein B [Sphingomonas sp. NFR15]